MKANKRAIGRLMLKILSVIVVVTVTLMFVLALYRMDGNSMFPSVRDGDLAVFCRLQNCYSNDIVLYEAYGTKKVGRVIAVPGQTVDFLKDGGYEVDGNFLYDEVPYETYKESDSSVEYPITLGEGEYFILNDFRSDANDSRVLGAINKYDIVGKALYLFRRRGF